MVWILIDLPIPCAITQAVELYCKSRNKDEFHSPPKENKDKANAWRI